MLKYEQVRPRIKTGDLISCEGTGLFSRLVQRFTRTSVSHSGLAVWAGDSLWILESTEPSGVQVRALSHIGNFKWLPLKMTETARKRIARNGESHIGRIPYSKRGILLQILRPLLGEYVDKWLDDGRAICSRYVAWHLRAAVAWDSSLRPPAAPSPAALELWCEKYLHDQARSDGSVRVSNPLPEPINLK